MPTKGRNTRSNKEGNDGLSKEQQIKKHFNLDSVDAPQKSDRKRKKSDSPQSDRKRKNAYKAFDDYNKSLDNTDANDQAALLPSSLSDEELETMTTESGQSTSTINLDESRSNETIINAVASILDSEETRKYNQKTELTIRFSDSGLDLAFSLASVGLVTKDEQLLKTLNHLSAFEAVFLMHPFKFHLIRDALLDSLYDKFSGGNGSLTLDFPKLISLLHFVTQTTPFALLEPFAIGVPTSEIFKISAAICDSTTNSSEMIFHENVSQLLDMLYLLDFSAYDSRGLCSLIFAFSRLYLDKSTAYLRAKISSIIHMIFKLLVGRQSKNGIRKFFKLFPAIESQNMVSTTRLVSLFTQFPEFSNDIHIRVVYEIFAKSDSFEPSEDDILLNLFEAFLHITTSEFEAGNTANLYVLNLMLNACVTVKLLSQVKKAETFAKIHDNLMEHKQTLKKLNNMDKVNIEPIMFNCETRIQLYQQKLRMINFCVRQSLDSDETDSSEDD